MNWLTKCAGSNNVKVLFTPNFKRNFVVDMVCLRAMTETHIERKKLGDFWKPFLKNFHLKFIKSVDLVSDG